MRKLAVTLLVAGLAVLLAPFVPAAAAAAAPAQGWLRLSLTSMQPSMVTSSDTSVLMTGRITNISDRHIQQLTVRIQVGEPLDREDDTPDALRSALSPTANFTHSSTVFTPVNTGGALAPGQSADFSVTEQLQGAQSLQISQPGVYPLMVNVQGVPDYGNTARLVVGTMLLPVLAPPGGHPPHVAGPSHLTVLWPLVDTQPRVVGTEGHQIVLSDDSLARSLGSGGRLFGLLDAVRQAAQGNAALLSSLCFAVDPDLLDTVRQMAAGYRVRSGSAHTVPGQGAAAANLWLATLKGLTAGHCVLVLPYADADVAALAHAGGTSLLQLALSEGSSVADELGASHLTNVAWPADDALDPHTMAALAQLGVNTVLLDPAAVTPPATTGPATLAGFTGGAAPKMLPIDPFVSAAMTPRTDEPDVDEAGISAQDGLAATMYQTVFGGAGGRPVLIAPPRRWSPSASQAAEFLSDTAAVLDGHYATATPLGDAAAAAPTGRPVALSYPRRAGLAEVAHQVVAGAVTSDGEQRDVQNAMGRDHTTPDPVLPSQLVTPLRLGLLRAASSAWRDGQVAGARAQLTDTTAQFEALAGEVTVLQPNLPILLGSKDSRLPVTVNNKLPVDIAVRVDLTGEPGLPSASKEDLIPAGGSVTVFIPTTVTRSGRFSAFATVRTLAGTQLGQPARIELVSSAYGTIVVVVTAIAFGLLILLSGRRIYRRVKTSRAAAGRHEPDPRAVAALVGAGKPADRGHSEGQEPDRQ
jgi:hypothetical protein